VIVYGRNPVLEALRGRRGVRRAWATERAAREDWLGVVRTAVVSPAELTALCGSEDHQGVCAEVDPYPYVDAESLLVADTALVVCLDQVHDPHNLGAVCRVAEAGGAAGVVIPGRGAAQVTPAVCKASAGAVEHLPVARVRNLADYLVWAKQAGAWVYGAAAGAQTPWDRPDYRDRVVLVLGSEGRGLRPRVAAACDELVALPLRGKVGSLNVATAAGALVYGILHLRESLDRAP
jgi:23S rRNA (guanosine2251-2'-O)-methyltransferase